MIEAATSPVDQETLPAQLEAVRTVEPPAQIEAGEAESVGAEGIGSTVMANEFEGADVPQASAQVAVRTTLDAGE